MSMRVLCFSVCQFHIALFDEVRVVLYYYATDFCVFMHSMLWFN